MARSSRSPAPRSPTPRPATSPPPPAAPLAASPTRMWQTDRTVWSSEYAASRLYLGGDFTAVRPPGAALDHDDEPRSGLASLDTTTGAATSWAPQVTGGAVLALATVAGFVHALTTPKEQTVHLA